MSALFPRLFAPGQLPGLRYHVSTRLGGVSKAPFASLNLGFHVGDDAASVRRNRKLLASSAGYAPGSLVAAQQVHGAVAHHATRRDAGNGALAPESAIAGADALFTRESGLPLLMMVADCAPVLLADASSHALGVVHAGWRGAVAGVAGATVAAMGSHCGTRPGELRAAIGPCLCTGCLEVGSEVAVHVTAVHAGAVVPPGSLPGQTKPHLDLRALIEQDLVTRGVAREHIESSPLCPRCHNTQFFSHRGEKGTTGRFGLVAWWED